MAENPKSFVAKIQQEGRAPRKGDAERAFAPVEDVSAKPAEQVKTGVPTLQQAGKKFHWSSEQASVLSANDASVKQGATLSGEALERLNTHSPLKFAEGLIQEQGDIVGAAHHVPKMLLANPHPDTQAKLAEVGKALVKHKDMPKGAGIVLERTIKAVVPAVMHLPR